MTAIVAPPAPDRTTLVRRVAGGALLAAALMNLLSALTPPLRSRLRAVSGNYPLGVYRSAVVITVLAGLALLQLARGVRRGQRSAWLAAVVLLVVSALSHIAKGIDVEEAVVGLAIVVFLLVNHDKFRAPADRESAVKGLVTIAVGGLVAIAAGVIGLQLSRRRTGWGRAIEAVSERLVGVTAVPIGGVVGPTLSTAMGAVGIALALSAGWMLVRPVLRVSDPGTAVTLPEARRYVAGYGGDTLAYFALRSDKEHVRVGDTLVAYAVHSGVCLVSPDPIGPVADREAAWNAFRQHVTRHGWSLAVLGAGDAWLPIYLASGMYQRYIGDEAIVDCQTFRLEGGPMKGLRQAVNRVAKYGYTIEFFDPAVMGPAMAARLRLLMTESRQGQVERGFSMTLSRIFDADDVGLLLAVAFGPDGAPVAFCQYVPAFDIDGYSLDLMRRSETGDHPNGLTDFVLVRTIEHLREQGKRGLSLNFATMRAVLAGEMGDGFGQRMERRVVEKLSASMQIESLWRYNAKFFPEWRRRYLVYDAPEHLVSIGMAVATAEQFWELPVIGRLLPTGVPERA